MLDFLLVLGQIPGTRFQITFFEYLICVVILGGIIMRRRLRLVLIAQKNNFVAYLKLKYWQHKQLSLPV
jgi:hypothetical protein